MQCLFVLAEFFRCSEVLALKSYHTYTSMPLSLCLIASSRALNQVLWKEYAEMEAVLHSLIHNRAMDQQQLRIWVSGCSTGEEAYSVAMLVQDYIDQNGIKDLDVRIMASDVKQASLEIAELGVYGVCMCVVQSQTIEVFMPFKWIVAHVAWH